MRSFSYFLFYFLSYFFIRQTSRIEENNEGIPVTLLQIQGVEIRKSTWKPCNEVREGLQEFAPAW